MAVDLNLVRNYKIAHSASNLFGERKSAPMERVFFDRFLHELKFSEQIIGKV